MADLDDRNLDGNVKDRSDPSPLAKKQLSDMSLVEWGRQLVNLETQRKKYKGDYYNDLTIHPDYRELVGNGGVLDLKMPIEDKFGLAYTSNHKSVYDKVKNSEVSGIKAGGDDDGWYHYIVGNDSHRHGDPRFKSYATFNGEEGLNLKAYEIQGFLEHLRTNGYSGQIDAQ